MRYLEIEIKGKKRVVDLHDPISVLKASKCEYPAEAIELVQRFRREAPAYIFELMTFPTGYYIRALHRSQL